MASLAFPLSPITDAWISETPPHRGLLSTVRAYTLLASRTLYEIELPVQILYKPGVGMYKK